MQRGKIVRVMQLQTGTHRAWFTRERPGGCQPERVTLYALGRSTGKILDDIRGGAVYEAWNGNEHRAVGYLYWAADEWLAELLASAPVTYAFKSSRGRVIRHHIGPLDVQAVPQPPRREVMADA